MKEIVIVAHNHPGLMADIAAALAERNINIESIDAKQAQELAVMELTVDRYDEALTALRDAGFNAITEDAIVISLPDQPGALAKVAKRFKDARIDMQSLRILQRNRGTALVALATKRTDEAMELLREYLVRE